MVGMKQPYEERSSPPRGGRDVFEGNGWTQPYVIGAGALS